MTHALKTWPSFYLEIQKGLKTFELRKADRPFKIGDTLLLQEYDNDKKEYTGNEMPMEVIYVFSDEAFGLKKGYVLLGIQEKTLHSN